MKTYSAIFWDQSWGEFSTPGAARQQVNLVRHNLFGGAPDPFINTQEATMPRPQVRFPPLPPLSRLQELFNLDPDTGHVIRRIGIRGGGKAGTRAGAYGSGKAPRRRRWVQIDGNQYDEARVVYALHTGRLPSPHDSIEHMDGNRSNNAPSNLKFVSGAQPQPNVQTPEEDRALQKEMEVWL